MNLLGADDISAMTERELVGVRRHRIGYAFQSFGLISVLSVAENVEIPLRLIGFPPEKRDARVRELLQLVGLAGHAEQRPYELSGGQQQRVALARALACDPDLLIADEPTGQLDSQTGQVVMDLIRDLVHERGMTAVLATHDPAIIDRADRVLEIRNGKIATAA